MSAPCLVRVKTRTRSIAGSSQQRLEQGLLAARRTKITLCSTRSAVVADRGHRDLGRVAQEGVGQRRDRLRHGGREEQGLALLRQHASTMRFRSAWMKPRSSIWSASSRTRISTSRQAQRPAVDEVEQAAGRGDENVDAVRQVALLLADRHAAEHDGGGEPQVAAIGAEAVGDLARRVRGSG